tara:strand:+ start:22648 stop:23019 length:372 start_codon:yes stop_codon:yes gene_type:complete
MSQIVKIIGKSDFLEVKLSGERKPNQESQDAIEAFSVIQFYCAQFKLNKVLIHIDLAGDSKREEILKMLTELENKGWGKDYKIALFYIKKENNSFTQILTKELGWNVGFFFDYTQAKDWLLTE